MRQDSALSDSLTCLHTYLQTDTHQSVLRRFFVRVLRQRNIPHAGKSAIPFEQGTRSGTGMYNMDGVTTPHEMLTNEVEYERHDLMLHVTG